MPTCRCPCPRRPGRGWNSRPATPWCWACGLRTFAWCPSRWTGCPRATCSCWSPWAGIRRWTCGWGSSPSGSWSPAAPTSGRAPGCGSSGIGIASICLMCAPRRGWASMPTPAVPLLLGEKGVRSMSRAAVPSMPSESSSEPPSEPPGVGSPPAQRVDATLSHGLSWEVEGSDKRKGSAEKLRSEETLAAAVQLDRPGPDGSAGDLVPDVAALKAPEWPAAVHVQDELELAARYAPILILDDRERFLPDAVGYRLFRENAPSPSFPREIRLEAPGASLSPDVPITLAIEYAIWWDWDIEHLYELEHVWVYVDAGGRPVRVEASWHGEWRDLRLGQAGGAVLEGTRPVVYVKPGKHALAA